MPWVGASPSKDEDRLRPSWMWITLLIQTLSPSLRSCVIFTCFIGILSCSHLTLSGFPPSSSVVMVLQNEQQSSQLIQQTVKLEEIFYAIWEGLGHSYHSNFILLVSISWALVGLDSLCSAGLCARFAFLLQLATTGLTNWSRCQRILCSCKVRESNAQRPSSHRCHQGQSYGWKEICG